MGVKRYKSEEIISKLREAEVLLAQGLSVGEVVRQRGVMQVTYYRWRKEYGGMKVDQAKRLKDLEKENARLKCLLADAELDKAILKEAASGPEGQRSKTGRALPRASIHRARVWRARCLTAPSLLCGGPASIDPMAGTAKAG